MIFNLIPACVKPARVPVSSSRLLHWGNTHQLVLYLSNQFLLYQNSPQISSELVSSENAKFMPISTPSFSSMPTRHSIILGQREFKRQLDQTRRDTKQMMRKNLATSSKYSASPRKLPEVLLNPPNDHSHTPTLSPLLSPGSHGSPNISSISSISSPTCFFAYTSQLTDVYGSVFSM